MSGSGLTNQRHAPYRAHRFRYYEMTVSIEGEATFGVYAVEIKAVRVTDIDTLRKVAGTV